MFKDYTIDVKEIISLLEAPAIPGKPQWELRSYMYCEKKIRPILSTYPATSLILLFGEHFDVNIHLAVEQVE